MKSNVTYSKEHREQAARETAYLITFDADGKGAKRGRMTMQGTLTAAEAEAMIVYMQEKFLTWKKKEKGK